MPGPLPPNLTTVLAITGPLGRGGIPPYAARGLKQTLDPIAAGAMTRRTVNGALVNLAPPQFQKYKSAITGSDQQPPAIDGIFPGLPVTVDCIVELSFPTGGAPDRPAVPGSSRIEGNFVFYRPRLDMLITGYSIDTDEYGATVGWKLDLAEV